MKRKLLSLAMLSIAICASAQQDIYALTGKNSQNIVFSDFRTLDVHHGVSGNIIFGAESVSYTHLDVYKRQQQKRFELRRTFPKKYRRTFCQHKRFGWATRKEKPVRFFTVEIRFTCTRHALEFSVGRRFSRMAFGMYRDVN